MKKFDWERFKEGTTAVRCRTQKEADSFMEQSIKKSIPWGLGIKISCWSVEKEKTCYGFHKKSGIFHGNFKYYENEGRRIIEWSNFMDEPNKYITHHQQCLEKAIAHGCKEHKNQQSNRENYLEMTARLWSTHTGHSINPTDVCMMLAMLNIARIKAGVDTNIEGNFSDIASCAAFRGLDWNVYGR